MIVDIDKFQLILKQREKELIDSIHTAIALNNTRKYEWLKSLLKTNQEFQQAVRVQRILS